jgi:hypothetical protein
MAAARATGSRGGTSMMSSPTTSVMEVTFEAMTGQPQAIASRGVKPKPS